MTLAYPSLAIAGALLALVPIALHLMRRRRRVVQWAAIDFLLESDRRNRARVRVGELLLLAARVLCVLLAGLLAAGPKSAELLGGWFGSDRALHLVLLDDSASMSQQEEDQTAWDEASRALDRLADSVREAGDELVVARYSDHLAAREPASVIAINQGSTPNDPAAWRTTYAAAGPAAGLRALADAAEAAPAGARRFACWLSDFSDASHGEGKDLLEPLRELADATSGVVLGRCGDRQAANRAITELTLAPGPRAAGVEATLRLEVTNHASTPSDPVAVTLRRNAKPLTALRVGPFEPNERRTVELPVAFAGTGLHTIEASLPADRLSADNRRWLAVDLPAAQQVLLVDPSESGREGRVFATALRPRPATRSGWAPRVVEKLQGEDLATAAAVLLLDPPRLSAGEARRLREFVGGGGGVLAVLGPRLDAQWFNAALGAEASEPLTPWRLGAPTSVPIGEPGAPLLEVANHPAVRVLSGDRNRFLPMVRVAVRRKLSEAYPPATLTPASVQGLPSDGVLAEFLDGEPFLMEARQGAGRMIGMFTTGATGGERAPPWSNLATLPIFPILVNDLVAWSAQQGLLPRDEPIGEPYERPVDPRSVLRRWDASGEFSDAVGLAPLSPAEPGVYQRTTTTGADAPFAAYVEPTEGDLRGASLEELRKRFAGLAQVEPAASLFGESSADAGRSPLLITAALLLALMAAERWLALHCSHLASQRDAVPGGRRR